MYIYPLLLTRLYCRWFAQHKVYNWMLIQTWLVRFLLIYQIWKGSWFEQNFNRSFLRKFYTSTLLLNKLFLRRIFFEDFSIYIPRPTCINDDALCHVWLQLTQWFWRRSRKCKNIRTDGLNDAGQIIIRKAYLSFNFRSGELKRPKTNKQKPNKVKVSFRFTHSKSYTLLLILLRDLLHRE